MRRHAGLTEELVRLAAERADAAKQLATAQSAADAVAALKSQLKQAELVAAAAEAARTTSVAAVNDRRRLREGIDEKAATVVELEAAAVEAAQALTTATEVLEAADSRRGQARTTVATPRPAPRRLAEPSISWPTATQPNGLRRGWPRSLGRNVIWTPSTVSLRASR